jgi:hypothetical protein
MKIVNWVALLILIPLFWGCASSPERGSPEELYQAVQAEKLAAEKAMASANEDVVSSLPKWWDNPPASGLAIYARGEARKSNLTLATRIATAQAKNGLAEKFGLLIEGFEEQYLEEVDENASSSYQAGARSAFSANLKGWRVFKSKTLEVNGKIQVYVLLEYPIAEANKFLVNELKKDSSTYVEARKSDAFRQMEELLNKQ